jgi:antitoxin component YwqK of YwqJK toxin-antitoxin module
MTMKNFLFLIGFLLLLNGCGTAPSGPANAALDLSGFEISDISGSDLKKAVRFGANGLLAEEGTVRNGKRFGTWVIYQENKEVPRSIANYEDDKLSGTYMEFNPQGQIELVCRYHDNQLNGRFARYRLGRKTEEGAYKDGQYEGTFRKYFKSMDVIQQESEYKAGKLDGITRYFGETGNLLLEYEYRNGEQIRSEVIKKPVRGE